MESTAARMCEAYTPRRSSLALPPLPPSLLVWGPQTAATQKQHSVASIKALKHVNVFILVIHLLIVINGIVVAKENAIIA